MRFLPAALIVAVTVSPSTGQPAAPVTVTVTAPLFFLLSGKLLGDTETDSGSHTVGVGVTIGVGDVGGGVGTVGANEKLATVGAPAATVTACEDES